MVGLKKGCKTYHKLLVVICIVDPVSFSKNVVINMIILDFILTY